MLSKIENNKVLVIRNSYRTKYGFPGGHINPEETAIQAVVRELQEETSIIVKSSQLQQIQYTSYHRNNIVCSDTLFKCHLNKQPKITLDNREVIESQFIDSPQSKKLSLQDTVKKYLSIVTDTVTTT